MKCENVSQRPHPPLYPLVFNDCGSLKDVAQSSTQAGSKNSTSTFLPVLWGRKQAVFTKWQVQRVSSWEYEQGICVTIPFLLAGPTADLKPQDKNFKQLNFISAA